MWEKVIPDAPATNWYESLKIDIVHIKRKWHRPRHWQGLALADITDGINVLHAFLKMLWRPPPGLQPGQGGAPRPEILGRIVVLWRGASKPTVDHVTAHQCIHTQEARTPERGMESHNKSEEIRENCKTGKIFHHEGVPGGVPAASQKESKESHKDGAPKPAIAGVIVIEALWDGASQHEANVDHSLLDSPVVLAPPQSRLHGADDGGGVVIGQPCAGCLACGDVHLHANAATSLLSGLWVLSQEASLVLLNSWKQRDQPLQGTFHPRSTSISD